MSAPAEQPPADDAGVWVRADLMPDGTYLPVVTIGADRVWPLAEPEEAHQYAALCIGVATMAEHDAALFALTRDRMRQPPHHCAGMVADVRKYRPGTWDGLPGQTFEPMVTIEGKPFVVMRADGCDDSQLTPTQLRDHGTAVLQVLATSLLDGVLRKVLLDVYGTDAARAAGVIMALTEHWPATTEDD